MGSRETLVPQERLPMIERNGDAVLGSQPSGGGQHGSNGLVELGQRVDDRRGLTPRFIYLAKQMATGFEPMTSAAEAARYQTALRHHIPVRLSFH